MNGPRPGRRHGGTPTRSDHWPLIVSGLAAGRWLLTARRWSSLVGGRRSAGWWVVDVTGTRDAGAGGAPGRAGGGTLRWACRYLPPAWHVSADADGGAHVALVLGSLDLLGVDRGEPFVLLCGCRQPHLAPVGDEPRQPRTRGR